MRSKTNKQKARRAALAGEITRIRARRAARRYAWWTIGGAL